MVHPAPLGKATPALSSSGVSGILRLWSPWWPAWCCIWLLGLALVEAVVWGHPAAGLLGGTCLRLQDHLPVLLLAPLLGLPWLRWPALLVIAGHAGWQVGMHELDRIRGGTVGDDELAFALLDADSLRFLLRMLAEPVYAFALGGAALLLAVPPLLLARRWPRIGWWVLALMLGVLATCPLLRLHLDRVHGDDPAWRSALKNPGIRVWRYLASVSAGPGRLDAEGVAALRAFESDRICDLPGDPALAGLEGRYRGRSILLVLLESHRAAHTRPWSVLASGYPDFIGCLGRRRAQGLAFDGWVGMNYKTSAALWSLLTALPEPAGLCPPVNDPDAVPRLGLWGAFAQAGCVSALHQAGPLRFENTGRMLEGFVGMERLRSDQAAVPADQQGYWGMDDGLCFAQALRRLEEWRCDRRQAILLLGSVAAHRPYDFPRPPGVPADHPQAMAYTEDCLDRLLNALDTWPESERPLVFITGDHGYGDGLRPGDEAALLRLPALLLLPDGAAAGRVSRDLHCHADLGGLFAGLLGLSWPGPSPFRQGRRAVLGKSGDRERFVCAPPLLWREVPSGLNQVPFPGEGPGLETALARDWLRLADAAWR